MNNKLLACTVVLLALFFNSAKAQSDTSNYDLGRITLQRKFTQAITIKAADMEKMPFSSLSEVINIYFNGIYGNKQTLAYVIDGNLNTDIGAYSIYDIEEITFIQNAATVLNGITPTQVLVLVKTKRGGAGRSGIMVNGQTNVISMYTNHIEPTTSRAFVSGNTTTNLYHQYYLSGYVNKKKYTAGVSASVQHNVFSQYWNKAIYSTIKPYTSNRFRFNGYIDVKLGKKNVLSVSGGYVPQRDNQTQILAFDYPNGKKYEQHIYDSQNLWYADVKLKSQLLKGLTNVLSAGFQRVQVDASYFNINPQGFNIALDSVAATNSYLVKDELSYALKIGDLTINPAINITYRQSRDSASLAFGRKITKQKLVVITPSITVNYDDLVMLQGGIQKITNTNVLPYKGYELPKLLPFGSVSVDVLRPFDVPDTVAKLMVFGSFSRSPAYTSDLTGALSYHINLLRDAGSGTVYNGMFNPYKTYDQLQGGITLSLFKNAISFSYNYNIQKFNTGFSIPSITAPYYIDTLADASVYMHRVGVSFKLINGNNFSWSSGLSATMIIKKQPDVDYLSSDLMKNFYPGKRFITGGFTNQLAYRKFVGGVDVVYGINKARYSNGRFGVTVDHVNIIDLQNFYVGYKVPVQKVKYLEVYVNARNLLERGIPLQPENSLFYDDRRFIGAGFKLEL
jgi:hypothetical protein